MGRILALLQTIATILSCFVYMSYTLSQTECFVINKTGSSYLRNLRRHGYPLDLTVSGVQDGHLVKLLAPPPNLTGDLHIGHGLNFVGGDIFLKYCEMNGADVNVEFGNDHAGHGFQKYFTQKYGTLDSDYQRLKAALNNCKVLRDNHLDSLHNFDVSWNRSYWTLSRRSKRITKETFIKLYNDGLLEESHWPTFARYYDDSVEPVSAADVDVQTQKKALYEIKFHVKDTNEEIIATTTHPEFYHGTVALGVSNGVFESLVGRWAIMPSNSRLIPILPLDKCRTDKARLIIPAHFESDFFFAKEHHLDIINIVGMDGKLQNVPSHLLGLTLNDAKADLSPLFKESGFVMEHSPVDLFDKKTKIIVIPTAHWVLHVEPLSKVARNLLITGKVQVHPKSRTSMLRKRLESTRPWCISRNGWWGINLPIWYLTNGVRSKTLFADTLKEAEHLAEEYLKMPFTKASELGYTLEADKRVFDTWFTSALWPIIIGFNDKPEGYYRTTRRLVYTCYDILESWITKMLILCPKFLDNNSPFDQVILHGMVIDNSGRKMSKSVGNTFTLDSLIDENTKKFSYLNKDAYKSACRIQLAQLTSQSDFAHRFSHNGRSEYLLNKIHNITEFIRKVGEDTNITNFEDISSEVESSFLKICIGPALSHIGAKISNHIDNFEFDKALVSLQRFIKIFSNYLIPYYRFRGTDVGFLASTYVIMLRLMMPFISSFIFSMDLPLDLKFTDTLCVWPDFTTMNGKDRFNEFTKLVQTIRARVNAGETCISMRVPGSILEIVLLEKDYIEHLTKLLHNSVLNLSFY